MSLRSQVFVFKVISIHFEPHKEENLLTKDKQAVLKCPLFRDSTVTVLHLHVVGTALDIPTALETVTVRGGAYRTCA